MMETNLQESPVKEVIIRNCLPYCFLSHFFFFTKVKIQRGSCGVVRGRVLGKITINLNMLVHMNKTKMLKMLGVIKWY